MKIEKRMCVSPCVMWQLIGRGILSAKQCNFLHEYFHAILQNKSFEHKYNPEPHPTLVLVLHAKDVSILDTRFYVGLARTIYIRCIYVISGREITKYTVIYGAYIRFWPTLILCVCFGTSLQTKAYDPVES